MKIQIASDLHLELLASSLKDETLIRPAPEADLLVLAGDIDTGASAIKLFKDWPVPVLYVAGNHEYYGQLWEQTRADFKRECSGTQIRFLDNDSVVIDGVRFLGSTLWTNFQIRGFAQTQAMSAVEQRLNDYFKIMTAQGPLRALQTLEDHQISREWLRGQLSTPFKGETVVVTHHSPHPLSIHPRFGRDILNSGFMSDMTELLFHADLWLHGHTHDSFDYRVGRCRVVANPAGYARNGSKAEFVDQLQFENMSFDPSLVVEVAGH